MVDYLNAGLRDNENADKKVPGSPSGYTGQRFPDGEGILVIAGKDP